MYAEPIYYYVQGRFEKKTDPLYKDFRDYKYKKSIINDTYEKKFAVSVCGVAVLHDKPVIIFPKGYNLKGKDIIGEAKLMLHTFTQYLSDKKTSGKRCVYKRTGRKIQLKMVWQKFSIFWKIIDIMGILSASIRGYPRNIMGVFCGRRQCSERSRCFRIDRLFILSRI